MDNLNARVREIVKGYDLTREDILKFARLNADLTAALVAYASTIIDEEDEVKDEVKDKVKDKAKVKEEGILDFDDLVDLGIIPIGSVPKVKEDEDEDEEKSDWIPPISECVVKKVDGGKLVRCEYIKRTGAFKGHRCTSRTGDYNYCSYHRHYLWKKNGRTSE
jgi:hypothetical protein